MKGAGRTVLVTGASSGVGRAVARRLGREGSALVLSGRSRERLEETAAAVRESGARAIVCPGDLGRDEGIRSLACRVEEELDGLDVVVHAAGVIALDPVEATGARDLDLQYRVNLRAPLLLTRELLPPLRKRSGQVVFVNSTAGISASADASAYAATKHGLRALADSLRDEVNADGIRVLSVFLGRTATPMQEAVHRHEGRPYDRDRLVQPEDVAGVIGDLLTVGRTAEVTEVRIRPARPPLPVSS